MVLLPWDMHEFHPLEVLLELADLFEIGSNVGVLWRVALVGEVDEELGVSLDEQVLDAERDCGPENGEEAFSNLVGDLVLVVEAPVGEVRTAPAPMHLEANAPSKCMVQ